MWVSWWTKRGLGRFFSGFLQFSPTTNFIPSFLHVHLIHFVSFHQPLWWCVRRGRPALTYNIGASSHLIPRPDLVLDTSWGYFLSDVQFAKSSNTNRKIGNAKLDWREMCVSGDLTKQRVCGVFKLIEAHRFLWYAIHVKCDASVWCSLWKRAIHIICNIVLLFI